MARRKSKRRRIQWGQLIFWALSLLVALSMALAYVIQPPRQRVRRTPTPAPFPTPTSVLPTSTPTAPLLAPMPSPIPRPEPTETSQPTLAPVTSPTVAGTATLPHPLTPTPTPSPTGAAPITPTPIAFDLGNHFTFAVCGDSRDGDAIYRRVLDAVQNDGSAFLIHLGDIVSSGRESEWLAWRELMAGFTLPFFPVPGNHDSPDGQYVFTAHIHAYVEAERNSVRYIITGGCGAPLHVREHPEGAFYHYVRVHVDGTDVNTEVVRIEP